MTATTDSPPVARIPRSIEYYAEMPENRFHFELESKPGDEKSLTAYSLPKLPYVSPISKAGRRLAALADEPEADVPAAMKEIGGMLDPKVGAALAKLRDDQLYWLQNEWVAASGKRSLPESSASSRSSSSTKRPSKRTSSTKAPASGASVSTTSPPTT